MWVAVVKADRRVHFPTGTRPVWLEAVWVNWVFGWCPASWTIMNSRMFAGRVLHNLVLIIVLPASGHYPRAAASDSTAFGRHLTDAV